MRKRLFQSGPRHQDEINISPLIDVVFILLIFFIVTTVFVEETGVEVNKPQALSAKQLEKNSILIAITEEGKVVYGGRVIGVQGVGRVIRRLSEKDPMPVIIQVDKKVPAGLLVRVIDQSKIAGAVSVNIATEAR
ncbi:MAG: biopolymer transporter ExbD [Emcibacter sp.]|nr:biopolymer transporter ExbD [Emcibacter sp.]